MENRNRDFLQFISLSEKASLIDAFLDLSSTLVPLWVAVLVGLLVGWAWKPRWVSFLFLGIRGRPRLVWASPPGLGGRRFWFALSASVTAIQMLKECWLKFKAWRWPPTQSDRELSSSANLSESPNTKAASIPRSAVGDEDLRELHHKYYYNDGGVPWELMMEKSIPGMTYQAWRRDPQGGGPTEYRSKTVFEDANPEIVKDFYWDDEFRSNWDDMIIYSKSLEACTETGAEIAHWVRKFPFFCSDREYLIGRRIYESGGIYYCITKGVPYEAVPRQKKPRRVDVYSSSWCVRAVESPVTGEKTACEVTFLHSEDMGIQRDLAKLGVRQGMWNCVRKMEPGLRQYQSLRKSSPTLSFTASMAQLITRVPPSFFENSDETSVVATVDSGNPQHIKGLKWLVVGGAVALACGLDRGVVGKVIVFGLARRFSKLGRRH